MLEPRFKIYKELKAKDSSNGIKMWELHSEHVMMTCFELEPNCGHDIHSHENEQITYIVEGEMVIEIENEVHVLSKGDSIVIPPCVPHKTYTREVPTKAMDCWYPVRDDFIQH